MEGRERGVEAGGVAVVVAETLKASRGGGKVVQNGSTPACHMRQT